MTDSRISSIKTSLTNFAKEIPSIALKTAGSAGITAFTAAAFTSINPIAGAIVGGTSALTSSIADKIIEKTNCCPNSPVAKIAKHVATFVASIAIGAAVSQAAGYAITFGSALALSLGTIPVIVIGGLCIAGVVALVVAAIVAIAVRDGHFNTETMRASDSVPGAQHINQALQQIQEASQSRRAAAHRAQA